MGLGKLQLSVPENVIFIKKAPILKKNKEKEYHLLQIHDSALYFFFKPLKTRWRRK